jgi:single-strand DNA-binding protein
MSDNTVTFIGNLTRDPELRFTTSGTAVCSFGLALNKRIKTDTGWEDGDPSFVSITAWRQRGENAAASLAKGQRVVVTGEIKTRTYETDEGEKRSAFDVQAHDIGPSLRWATADVTRNDRNDDSRTTSTGASKPPPEYGEEEPF